MKVKLFTHTDLDGVGCAILAKKVFSDVDIEYCNYDNIDRKVKKFIHSNDALNYGCIFITDLSISKKLAEQIQQLELNGELHEVVLLDHHKTSEFLNEYSWCTVTVEENGEKTSGTRMLYDFFIKYAYIGSCDVIDGIAFKFVEIVRKYDTWLWETKYNDIIPKKWNDLLYIYGRELFIENVSNKLNNFNLELDCTDELLLKLEQEKINKYIGLKQKQLIEKDILGYKVGVVFAEQYGSELGNELSKLNPKLDFVVMIDPSRSVSYRTTKDDIDLGADIAFVFGGGGHPKAAGHVISDIIKKNIIDLIFDLTKE